MSLSIGLERPVAVQEQRALQLRLVEAHQLRMILAEDIVHLLLLLFGIDTTDIVVHNGELITALQHFLRTSTGTLSVLPFLTSHISLSFLRTAIVSRRVVTTRILSFARSLLLLRGILSLALVFVTLLRNFSCHLGFLL